MAQRQAEYGAAAQPRAGAVARVAGNGMHAFQDLQQQGGAELVAPGQRTLRIAQPQAHGFVDVIDTGNALLGNLAGEVDDGRQRALGDKADAVADHGDADTVAGQKGVGGVAHAGAGSRRQHQRAMAAQVGQQVDAYGPGRVGLPEQGGASGVAAVGSQQAQGSRRGRIAAFHRGAE